MSGRWLCLCLLVLGARLGSGAEAEEEEKKSNFNNNCYVCTSVSDPKCAETDSLESFKQSCGGNKPTGPDFEGSKAVGCRKILQEVEGEDRVVRQCAFSGDDVHAFKRTGNEGVRMFYYQCSDEDYCNAAEAMGASLYALALSLALAIFLR